MISERETDALNLVRWLSTIAIVVCHILQGYDNAWAYVFNIGVQIFFFLSGFLYGNKRIDSIANFYKKRIIKLYIPYFIWVTIAILLLIFVANSDFGFIQILKLYFLRGTVSGLGHLWFMEVLFICYLLLPLINILVEKINFLGIAIVLIVGSLLAWIHPTSTIIWILVYYCGYSIGRFHLLRVPLLVLTFLLSLALILHDDVSFESLKEPIQLIYILKSSIAIFCFLLGFEILRRIKLPKIISHILTIKGGYEIYLTHGLFVLGPISVLNLTLYKYINITIAITLSILSAYILIKTSKLITTKISKVIFNGVA